MTGRPQNSQVGALKKQNTSIRFCPKCGSTNLNPLVFYRPSIWKCLDCGYEGVFIIEDSKLAEKIRKKHHQTAEER